MRDEKPLQSPADGSVAPAPRTAAYKQIHLYPSQQVAAHDSVRQRVVNHESWLVIAPKTSR